MSVGRLLILLARAVSRTGGITGRAPGGSTDSMGPARRRDAQAARDSLRRSRRALQLMRRFGRF